MKVYVLTNDVDYEGSHTLGVYSNEDSALRALAERFNHTFNRYNILVKDGYEEAETIKPEWGSVLFSAFYTDDQSYRVEEVEVLD